MTIEELKQNIDDGREWLKANGFSCEDFDEEHFTGNQWQKRYMEIWEPDAEYKKYLLGDESDGEGDCPWVCFVDMDDECIADNTQTYGSTPEEALRESLKEWDEEMARRRRERFGAILNEEKKTMKKDENEKWLAEHGFELQSGGISEDMLQTDGKAWVRCFENFRIIVKYEDDIHYFLSEGYYYSAYDDKNPLKVGWRDPSAQRAVMLCIRDMNRFLTNESGNISQTLAYLTDFLYETVTEKEEKDGN